MGGLGVTRGRKWVRSESGGPSDAWVTEERARITTRARGRVYIIVVCIRRLHFYTGMAWG
jgi:hypothetical protein